MYQCEKFVQNCCLKSVPEIIDLNTGMGIECFLTNFEEDFTFPFVSNECAIGSFQSNVTYEEI